MSREVLLFLADLLQRQNIPVGDPSARELARLAFLALDELGQELSRLDTDPA